MAPSEQCSSLVGRIAPARKTASRGAMSHKVGIWIDHKKAVIVSASGDRVTAETLGSDVGPHTRYQARSTAGARKNTRTATANTLTGTTTRSSVSWGNLRPF